MSAFLFVMAMAGFQDAAAFDPAVPIKAGKAQCIAPDDAKKTCRSLITFTAKDDGTFATDSMAFIAPDGPMTFETTSVARIKDGAICGTLTTKQFDKAKLFYGPNQMPSDRSWMIIDRIETAMTPIMGKELCSKMVPADNGLFTATLTIGGVERPQKQTVRWVSPSDGYIVGRQ